MLADLLFLAFAVGLLASAMLVVAARNPMAGIMGMVMAFLNASGLFILFGAEFLGLLLIMVYVGAIAVMFLFVLMTIDVDFVKLREGVASYLPLGLLTVAALVAEIVYATQHSGTVLQPALAVTGAADTQNVVALGQVLFTTYALPFQLAGLVLLVAMVGAIVLAHYPRSDVKRQSVSAQTARRKKDCLVLTQPQAGQGALPRYWQPVSVGKKKGGEQ